MEDDSKTTDEVISIAQLLHNSFIFTLVPVDTSTVVIPVGQRAGDRFVTQPMGRN